MTHFHEPSQISTRDKEFIAVSQKLPEGTVTILFTDVVGSTDLTTSRGDEAAQEIMRAQRDLTRQQVEEHSGHEVKGLGDGFMVAFSSARQAVACAVGIQRALNEHNNAQPLDEQVQVRIGLNTGEVIHEEEDLFGEAVNAAARIAAKAKGRQILVSELVKGLLGRAKDVELVDRGRFRLKGFPERWHLFEVAWQEKTAVAPPLMERTPFVGRETERQELRRLLEQAVAGQGCLVMIGGEPGVGKTRLTQELALQAEQRGVTVRTGHCYEMEGSPPYTPFIELVQEAIQAAQSQPDALRSVLADSAPEVARIVPELRRMFPDLPPPLELPPDQERRYMFNSIRDFVDRASRIAPLLILIDDLHWADDSSLLLLEHFAQQLSRMPVLMLATYRDTELEAGRPLSRTMEALIRQRLTHRIVLKRLPEQGVSDMLRGLSGQEPPLKVVGAIYKETEGNAFFVEEVFHHLAEEGKLLDAEGRWLSDLEVSELDVPEGVRLVVGRRLDRVGEKCRSVLTAAAVIGRVFSFDLLSSLSEVDDDALLDALDDAERAHLITSTSEVPVVHFTFAHELIRQTLLGDVSGARRQRLHHRVADAIEHVYAANLDEHAAELAHHLSQAGASVDPKKIIRYFRLAGDAAVAVVAYEEGVGHYERAIEALELEGDPDETEHCDLMLAQGEAQARAGDTDRAKETLRRAVDIARNGRAPEQLARAAVGFPLAFGGVLAVGVVDEELISLLKEALAALEKGASPLRARVLGRLSAELYFSDSQSRRAELSQEALEMARRVDDPVALVYALRGRYYALWGPENGEERLAVATEIVRLGERAHDLEMTLMGHSWRLQEFLVMGDTNAADLEIDDFASGAEELGQPFYRWSSSAFRTLRALLAGRFDDAERLAEQTLTIGQGIEDPNVTQSFGLHMGMLRREQGRLQESEAVIKAFADQYPAVPAWRCGLAYVYSELGRNTEARAEFEGLASNEFGDLPRDWFWLTSLVYLTEVDSFLGDVERAKVLYDLLRPYSDNCIIIGLVPIACYGSAARNLGLLATTMGDWEAAEAHLEDALEMNARIGAPPWVAWTQHDYADMLLRRDGAGDREKALGLLAQAIDASQDMGMKALAQRASALSEKAGSDTPG